MSKSAKSTRTERIEVIDVRYIDPQPKEGTVTYQLQLIRPRTFNKPGSGGRELRFVPDPEDPNKTLWLLHVIRETNDGSGAPDNLEKIQTMVETGVLVYKTRNELLLWPKVYAVPEVYEVSLDPKVGLEICQALAKAQGRGNKVVVVLSGVYIEEVRNVDTGEVSQRGYAGSVALRGQNQT